MQKNMAQMQKFTLSANFSTYNEYINEAGKTCLKNLIIIKYFIIYYFSCLICNIIHSLYP